MKTTSTFHEILKNFTDLTLNKISIQLVPCIIQMGIRLFMVMQWL